MKRHLWLLPLLASAYAAALDADRMAAAAAVLDVTPEATALSGGDETRDYIVQRGQSREEGVDEGLVACATTTTAATACATTATTACTSTKGGGGGGKTAADELRDRVARLTDELYKAEAALAIAQQLEHKLDVLEREKYGYVKTASDTVLRLVDKLEHAERMMAADTNRERRAQRRLSQTRRLANRSARRLQVIRRLLAGAEVGLVHMESSRKLSGRSSDHGH